MSERRKIKEEWWKSHLPMNESKFENKSVKWMKENIFLRLRNEKKWKKTALKKERNLKKNGKKKEKSKK